GLVAAERVRCPAHLVLAEADQMTLPRSARDVAAALKATVHHVPGGHYLMQESPDAVLNALRKALAP
ncbi:MAG TPA: alpha/beta hydrolase, partial [Burkholderiaceae bacterium]|nr:alpha/beta hydrolase [Burkholderiaceae bacterium]